jgi:hypothetical protein
MVREICRLLCPESGRHPLPSLRQSCLEAVARAPSRPWAASGPVGNLQCGKEWSQERKRVPALPKHLLAMFQAPPSHSRGQHLHVTKETGLRSGGEFALVLQGGWEELHWNPAV